MADLDREYMEALHKVFQHFALEDQRSYYKRTIKKHREAARQVNKLRALFSFITGMASALVGFIVLGWLSQGSFANGGICYTLTTPEVVIAAEQNQWTELDVARLNLYCDSIRSIVNFLLITAIVAPAVGAAFTTLADLYQWDKLLTIYEVAVENIEVADALSPNPKIPEEEDTTYRAALRAFAEGTLQVMRDETAQWGQLVRTPEQLQKYADLEKELHPEVERELIDPNAPDPTAPEPTVDLNPNESDPSAPEPTADLDPNAPDETDPTSAG